MMTEAQALAALTQQDPAAADDAKAALRWLTGEEGLGSISLLRLQEFLWRVLPSQWPLPPRAQLGVARSLGKLLELAGLDRYAQACTSRETERIIAGYERDPDEGAAACAEAIESAPATPPDTDLLAWGTLMGPAERAAYEACAAALELAVACDEIRPGVSGWLTGRAFLTDRWLTQPDADDGTWLTKISSERIDDWVHGARGERASLARAIVPRLLEPPVTSDLPTLDWLLGRAADGIRLTSRHYISPSLIDEAVDRFGWQDLAPGHRRQELSVMPVHTLRTLAAREMGAIRRSGTSLVLTPAGRAMAADDAVRWHIGTSALIGAQDDPHPSFGVSAREGALLLTLVSGPLSYEELTVGLTELMSREGWTRRRGDSLAAAVCSEIHGLRHRLRALHLLGTADIFTAPISLSTAGTSAALSALLARALRPRHVLEPVPGVVLRQRGRRRA
jgi:hypothetical protein